LVLDVALALPDLRVGVAHHLDDGRHDVGQKRTVEIEAPQAGDNGPAHDPAQHVAAPRLVGRDAIGQEKHGRARMVGDASQCDVHRARPACWYTPRRS
jgi:hypothetical protein